jgi:hypothetical protein
VGRNTVCGIQAKFFSVAKTVLALESMLRWLLYILNPTPMLLGLGRNGVNGDWSDEGDAHQVDIISERKSSFFLKLRKP